jgi:ectoine hydroxylase-related dioxygenase (phytanoyl-CoA dioxygenase family)
MWEKAYKRDGFVEISSVVRMSILEPVVGVLDNLTYAAAALAPAAAAYAGHRKSFLAADGLRLQHPLVLQLSHDSAVHTVVARLLHAAPEKICIWRDQTFYKEPGDSATLWHSDASGNEPFLDIDGNRNSVAGLSAWIPLHRVLHNSGRLQFLSGSHQTQSDLRAAALLPQMNLGDVSFHSVDTSHAAEPNSSEKTRKVFVLMFAALEPNSNAKETSALSCARKEYGLATAEHTDL